MFFPVATLTRASSTQLLEKAKENSELEYVISFDPITEDVKRKVCAPTVPTVSAACILCFRNGIVKAVAPHADVNNPFPFPRKAAEADVTLYFFKDFLETVPAENTHKADVPASEDLAYIMYTSGASLSCRVKSYLCLPLRT